MYLQRNMWTRRSMPRGEVSPPPANIGKTIFAGGVIVAAGLSALYLNMLRNKHKQERDGTNPICMFLLYHIMFRLSTNATMQTNRL
ncbi:hypothetical protein Ac2012v2_006586 [Leucoagaricus gongylophorus]